MTEPLNVSSSIAVLLPVRFKLAKYPKPGYAIIFPAKNACKSRNFFTLFFYEPYKSRLSISNNVTVSVAISWNQRKLGWNMWRSAKIFSRQNVSVYAPAQSKSLSFEKKKKKKDKREKKKERHRWAKK